MTMCSIFIVLLTLLLLCTPLISSDTDSKKDSGLVVSETIPIDESEYEILPVYTRSVAATQMYKSKKNRYALWINNNKWIKADLGLNKESIYEFQHIDGEINAILLHDNENISLAELRAIVIANAKDAARDSKIVFEEKRYVNGKEMLCIQIEGSINYVPFTYLGYYYAGNIGTLQLITLSSPALFEEYEFELETFLDGLEVLK